MKIKEDIRDIIAGCRVKDNILFLPDAQFDRKVYFEINSVLEALGGRWDRKAKRHVFDESPADKIEEVVLTREYTNKKKEFQFFETPKYFAVKLCNMAEITSNCVVLEPSCGKGRIVREIEKRKPKHLICTEKNEKLKPYHDWFKFGVVYSDFLKIEGYAVDRIVMNSPFSRQQDVDHILKAFELLNSRGISVSVMSKSPFFRSNKKSRNFCDFLKSNGAEIEDLPKGTLKESGTMVNTCIVKIRKV